MTFTTTCDVCRIPIPSNQNWYHCFFCVSSTVPHSKPGDYDICLTCYNTLVTSKAISHENGPGGWRRCPQGHRMVVIGFQDGKTGQRRSVIRDLVGGRILKIEPVETPNQGSGLQKWYIPYKNEKKYERIVTKDVRATAPSPDDASAAQFPPDGGLGISAVAKWSWYPEAGSEDELLVPKGAEIREIDDTDEEWYHGVYMGGKGLVPARYVKALPVPGTSSNPAELQSDI